MIGSSRGVRLVGLLFAATLVACSGGTQGPADAAAPDLASADLSIVCPGSAPATKLIEGYCTAGEGDRCYYAQPPMDGF